MAEGQAGTVQDYGTMTPQQLVTHANRTWSEIKDRFPTSDGEVSNYVNEFDQILNVLNEKI